MDIGGFALALILLNGLLGYVDQNTMFGRVRLRISIINDLNEKACTTSYPNTRDPKALKLFEKAQDATRSNSRPAEHIWTTLTGLLLNLAGFCGLPDPFVRAGPGADRRGGRHHRGRLLYQSADQCVGLPPP